MPLHGQSDNDPYNLQRFVAAQESVFDAVRSELRAGYKRTHWMWFIFPQLRGLGRSLLAHESLYAREACLGDGNRRLYVDMEHVNRLRE